MKEVSGVMHEGECMQCSDMLEIGWVDCCKGGEMVICLRDDDTKNVTSSFSFG